MTSMDATDTVPVSTSDATDTIVAEAEAATTRIGQVRAAIQEAIFGQGMVVDQTLITVFSGGHALLIGVPGLAKTRLVQTMGTVLGLEAKRVQFTPDLMPADILGSEILEESESGHRRFRFIAGPVFCQLLMADEINRASPRTQSALLQSMQEHEVTVAGTHHALPTPFHVLATQNPLEQEGTYPLPEAQLDRFLLQIDVDYPDREAEQRMLLATTGVSDVVLEPVLNGTDVIQIQQLVRRMPVSEQVMDSILNLVRAARPDAGSPPEIREHVAWGPGPRASQAFMLAVRAKALIDGRLAPSVEDVHDLALPILRHRMALNFAARAEGVTLAGLIERLTHTLVRTHG